MTKLLGSWYPKILGMLQCLAVEPPLGAVGLAAEFAPKVYRHRPGRTWATGQAGFLFPQILLVLVTPGGVGTDVVFSCPILSYPKILSVLELLRVEPPLDIVGLDAEFVPRVYFYFFNDALKFVCLFHFL